MKDKFFPVLKIISYIIIVLFLIIKFINLKLFNNNYILIRTILNNSNHFISSNYTYKDKLNDILFYITDYNFGDPLSLFKNNYLFKQKEVVNDNLTNEYNYENNVNPLVYIYNTHNKEEYVNNGLEFNPTVYTASYILQNELLKRGISSIVEDNDINQYLIDNNMNYDDSYLVSRIFLEKVMKEYSSIKLFIDLHRDALSYNDSTTYYGDKYYSKILFVVGLDHLNYQGNLDLSNYLNNLVNKKYPYLSRGVLTKSGNLVNGVYNQDLGFNIILLEVGGNENNIEEVSNTLCLMSDIIYDYLGE